MTLMTFHLEAIFNGFSRRLYASVAFICLLLLFGFAHANQCRILFENETKSAAAVIHQGLLPSNSHWDRKKLRVVTFNAQDFTLYEKNDSKLDRATPKSEKSTKSFAKTIFQESPDIIVLQEVGSKYSLEKLASLSRDQYDVIFIPSHDNRGVKKQGYDQYARHIGFLIKKSLGVQHTLASNLQIPYLGTDPNRKYLFDRGLPVLTFFDPTTKQPLFSVIGVHNHSVGKGGKHADLKYLEEKSMAKIIQKLEDTYTDQHPVILAGDLNTEVNGHFRLSHLKTKMIESFDDLNVESISLLRKTHLTTNQRILSSTQVDGIFVSRFLKGRIQSSRTLPLEIDDISDHRPLLVDINLDGVLP